MMAQYVQMKPEDNVATALADLAGEASLTIGDVTVVLPQPIPFGHKFAVRAIAAGQPIIKYGQVIGTALYPIAPGEHAHIQNIESNRGRGDKSHAHS